ncbi:MAG: SH3 domain-containing protein [Alphaproteobacteria bacterium]|nr:SH3 domain-containing protein [Alphaproteobacteria bacterium]
MTAFGNAAAAILCLCATAAVLCVGGAVAAAGERLTGLPLPRYAAIRATEANLRVGPSMNYPVLWRYEERGLPVRIVKEHFDWRKVEDPKGETGWMSAHLLADWPRAIVTTANRLLRRSPETGARGVAVLEPGVVVTVLERREGWCRVAKEGHKGWLKSDEVWGACAGP